VAVAVVAVDGLFDSEQPTSASMIVTTRSGVARRIARMLATADRSTVASTRLWLKVFTSRRVRETVCDPGLAACSECLVSGRVTSLLPRRVYHPILSVCERRRGSLKLATGTRFDDACVATETGLGVIMDPDGSGFAAPGQEEQMRENQGVRIVEMFSCGTIQIVKFLLAGDA
jgi:hypothetical protein